MSILFRNKVNLFGLESTQYRLGRLSKDCQGLKSSSANSRSLLPAKAQGEELRKARRCCTRILDNVICRVAFLDGLSRDRGYRVTKRFTQACWRKTKGIKERRPTEKKHMNAAREEALFGIFNLSRSESREARVDVGRRSSRGWKDWILNDAVKWNERDMRNSLEHVSKHEGSQSPDPGRQGWR